MPENLDLRLAWAIGREARITGSLAQFFLFGPRVRRKDGTDIPLGNLTAAQVHYSPIVWQLVFAGAAHLSDRLAWRSVSSWTGVPETEAVPLKEWCPTLPIARLRRSDPSTDLVEMLSNENCFIVNCDDIAPSA